MPSCGQIEEMEHTEKSVKVSHRSTQREGRVGHGNEKVGEKRNFRDSCDTEGREAVSAQRPRGEAVAHHPFGKFKLVRRGETRGEKL
jgi:hypothetical protein